MATLQALLTLPGGKYARALMRESSVGKRLVEGYLHQPYSWFLSRHSIGLGKNILGEVR
jgi:hypothetical protein